MKPINVPEVTLIAVDGVARPLTEWIIDRTLRLIKPGAVIFSDALPETAEAADRELWRCCASAQTSHVLTIQYDGFPIDPDMWQDEYLKYDYIGAPWPHQGYAVGNGGFSLRSTAMMRLLDKNGILETPEDHYICISSKGYLEGNGFKFAPASLAHQFSFERCPKRRAFGMHGIFNIRKVLSADEFAEWETLANSYVRAKPEWAELMEA